MTYEEKEARIAELEQLIATGEASLQLLENELKLLNEDARLIFPEEKYFFERTVGGRGYIYYKVNDYIGYDYYGDFIVDGESISYKTVGDNRKECYYFKGRFTLSSNRDTCQWCTEKDFNDVKTIYFGN